MRVALINPNWSFDGSIYFGCREAHLPLELIQPLDGVAPRVLAVGPHGSSTSAAALRKLGVDGEIMGECEEVVARIAGGAWEGLPGLAHWAGARIQVNGGPQTARLEMPQDDAELVATWRERLRAGGVCANDPVSLFPYPGSPDCRRLWGLPDDMARERAVDHYPATFAELSDPQDTGAKPLAELERGAFA